MDIILLVVSEELVLIVPGEAPPIDYGRYFWNPAPDKKKRRQEADAEYVVLM